MFLHCWLVWYSGSSIFGWSVLGQHRDCHPGEGSCTDVDEQDLSKAQQSKGQHHTHSHIQLSSCIKWFGENWITSGTDSFTKQEHFSTKRNLLQA